MMECFHHHVGDSYFHSHTSKEWPWPINSKQSSTPAPVSTHPYSAFGQIFRALGTIDNQQHQLSKSNATPSTSKTYKLSSWSLSLPQQLTRKTCDTSFNTVWSSRPQTCSQLQRQHMPDFSWIKTPFRPPKQHSKSPTCAHSTQSSLAPQTPWAQPSPTFGSHISWCSSSFYFVMHQCKAQVHVYGCNGLQVTLQTCLEKFTVLTDCPSFLYYHALTLLAPNITDILWVLVPHTLTTRYNTVLADVNSLHKWSRVTWYAIYSEVQWNMSQQIQTLSGHINDTRNIYPALLWNALQNIKVQQQSNIIFQW